MFLKIIRFFIGCVSFTASGNSIERFFNQIARSGITIWNIKSYALSDSHKRYASADVVASEYKLLRPFAKKAGLRLKVQRKYGLPFVIRKYRKRIGLFIGVAIMCLTFYVLSLYIWVVRVEGNVQLSDLEIKSVVSELGLKPGVLKKYVDVTEIQHNTMIRLNGLSWISVNIEGCFATVSVNEAFQAPKIIPHDKPCNIKAIRSGQILRMEVYRGTQEVKNGDAVVEGQLLVNGIVEDSFGGSSINHASARAIALTKHEITQKVDRHTVEKIPTGKKVLKRRLHIFGFDIPITLQSEPKGTFDVRIDTDVAKVFGVPLPISLYKEDWIEQTESPKTLSLEEARAVAQAQFEETKQLYFQDKKIVREDREEIISDEAFSLNVTVSCEEDIAVEEPFDLAID